MRTSLCVLVALALLGCRPRSTPKWDGGSDAGADAQHELDAALATDASIDAPSGELIPSPTGNPPAPRPGYGEQYPVNLTGLVTRSCANTLRTSVESWARNEGFSIRTLYVSANAYDVELRPGESTTLKTTSSARLQEFEQACQLFYEEYAQRPDMRERLRDYLAKIRLDPAAVREPDMMALGFSARDTRHLIEHLPQFMAQEASREDPARFAGLLYLRVTYTFEPRAEYAITAGTIHRFELTPHQRKLIDSLRLVSRAAVMCER